MGEYKRLFPPFPPQKHTIDLSLFCMTMATSSFCAQHTERLHPITLEMPLALLCCSLLSFLMCCPHHPHTGGNTVSCFIISFAAALSGSGGEEHGTFLSESIFHCHAQLHFKLTCAIIRAQIKAPKNIRG